jgi:4-aminobutyrate aminotransferase-like enzyme/Ser/Thr protein kinase RdoA (MazF antagonist)
LVAKIKREWIEERPVVTAEQAAAFVSERYGMEAAVIRELAGERDRNYYVAAGDGREFVLKIAHALERLENLDLQNQVLGHLAKNAPNLPCPRVVTAVSGETIASIQTPSHNSHYTRLLTYLPGRPLAEVQPHSPALLENLGHFLGQMDAAMSDFSHPAAYRLFHWRATETAATIRRHLDPLPDHARRSLVRHFLNLFEGHTLPLLASLRSGVIQNDANDYNVLVNEDGDGRPFISGVIDFGDALHAPLVCEVAVAAAYAIFDKDDPLEAAAAVVKGYHQSYPLLAEDVASLYELISIRLCLSVTVSAYQQRLRPDDEYLSISERPGWEALEKLVGYEPVMVENRFRDACDMPPRPTARARSKVENLALRQAHIGPSLSVSYREPLKIVRGFRQYLYDENGRRYLDCVNNVAHVGHCHPTVVEVGQRQMALLNTNTRYLHNLLAEYAERLCATFPEPLNVCYFVCSGSEANELALRLARTYTNRHDILVVDGAYHGNTATLVEISPYKFKGPGGRGKADYVHVAPMPDGYRGPYKGQGVETGQRYASHVREAVETAGANGRPIAAFMCESLMGCGGQIVLPEGYLKAAFEAVRAAGGVCIADEVQVGFGRVGRHFWGFELQGVVPDIVTLGKPMGNGHPLAAVVTTPEIAAAFANGMEYFNTFGGNPVSCAIGMAVLDVIEAEGLQERAGEVGRYLMAKLKELQNHHPLIGDVRGEGLFIGIELVKDRETLEPAGEEAAAVVEAMKNRGILLSTDGPLHNVIKIKPPLVFNKDDADFLVGELVIVLK